MNKKLFLISIISTILLMPVLTMAKHTIRAGTDDYLRYELGYTGEMLAEQIVTEKRENFKKASGQTKVTDPLGDVLDRLGATSSIQAPWGDIETAQVSLNTLEQAWEIKVEMGGLVPGVVSQEKAQLFVYMDSDGAYSNNDYDGTGVDMDKEFSLQYNEDEGWYTDYKWYNAPEDFWAFNEETAATFLITGKTMTVYVPFDEVAYDADVHWRVIMALKDGTATQIDVAPTVGFPAPLDSERPEEKFQWPELTAGWIVLIVSGLIALVYGLWVALSGRMKSCQKE